MEFFQKSKKEKESCVKSSSSSFSSAMLCFLHGFSEGDQKNSTKDQKNFRFRLLRKSRSTTNFNTTPATSGSSMVVPRRTHNRTQSAVSPSIADISGPPRAVHALAGSASAASLLQVHRSPSPSQGVFTKVDKASLKLLSTSSPAMTAQSQIAAPPSPKPPQEDSAPSAPKARQKKFHRHFPTVESDEKVLNYYSCALIADILLQGHLYITKNYFAFYSNVFGYVTKLLIPMLTVEKITKEKTARIIPNAVGITTADDKHVFGSLMSRDNTFKYMVKVWEISQQAIEMTIEPEALVEPDVVEIAASESDSSETKEDSERECTAPTHITRLVNIKTPLIGDTDSIQKEAGSKHISVQHKLLRKLRTFFNLPTQTLFLLVVTLLLIMLVLSSTFLLYRISKIHDKYISLLEDLDLPSSSDDILSHLLRISKNLHGKSANSMHNFIDSNLHQIAKVRQDLELLSSLLVPKDSSDDAKVDRDFNSENS